MTSVAIAAVTVEVSLRAGICAPKDRYTQASRRAEVVAINWGGAGGLEAQVTIEDQQKWDGKGSPPGAVGKSGTPPTINTAD